MLIGHTIFTRNPAFRVFGVSVFNVHWFTIHGTACTVIVFHDEFLTMRQTHLTSLEAPVCGWYEVGKTVIALHFPWKGQVLIQKYVSEDCPVEVM